MATISARGCSKVAQASKSWTDEDGYQHKLRIALRSDGKVLKAHDLLSPTMAESYGSRGWNRSGYSIAGALPATPERSSLERFRRYAAQNGYQL